MRFLVLIILAICHFQTAPARAGAWLREEGTSFLSTSFSATYFRDIFSEVYAEHGLRADLTIGFDFGLATLRNGLQSGYASAFIRRPLMHSDGPHRLSYELGVGAAWLADEVSPTLKTGLSWGRGFKLGEDYGWVNVDAAVHWDLRHRLHIGKLDTTVGLNFTDKTAAMLQVFVSHIQGETYTSVAPTVIFAPKTDKFRITFGAEAPLQDTNNTRLKIGIWRTF